MFEAQTDIASCSLDSEKTRLVHHRLSDTEIQNGGGVKKEEPYVYFLVESLLEQALQHLFLSWGVSVALAGGIIQWKVPLSLSKNCWWFSRPFQMSSSSLLIYFSLFIVFSVFVTFHLAKSDWLVCHLVHPSWMLDINSRVMLHADRTCPLSLRPFKMYQVWLSSREQTLHCLCPVCLLACYVKHTTIWTRFLVNFYLNKDIPLGFSLGLSCAGYWSQQVWHLWGSTSWVCKCSSQS